MRVLLVEDEETLAATIQLMLRAEKCEVVTAALGDDGLRLAGKGDHDIILLDLNLPDMSAADKDEPIARIHAIVRRPAEQVEAVVRCGDLTVRLAAKTAEIAREPAPLTGKDFAMLEI